MMQALKHNIAVGPNHKIIYVTVRSNDANGKASFAEALRNANWALLYRMNDCNEMLNFFYGNVSCLLNFYLPLHVCRRHGADKPWIDDNFRMLIKQRQYAWQQGNKQRYEVIRNQVQREASKLRRKYYSKHVHSLRRSGPRQWWSEVKKLTGQSSTCPLNTIADRLYGGDMQQMAEDINKFFYSVSDDLDPLDQSLVPSAPDVCPDEFIIEPYQVERKLSVISVHKSCGPDDVPNWVWRDFSRYLAEPICAIYNASVRQGVVPDAWKRANVVPIPKVNPPTAIQTDFRPISLTPTLSKILESVVGKWILTGIQDKLDKRQYGALKGR